MTDNQRKIFMLFCMSGRTQEAEEYKAECEAKEAAKAVPSPDKPLEEDGK